MAEEWPSYGPEKKSRPNKSAAQRGELGPRADTVTTLTKAEAQRVLAWFGSATIAAPGDFELAARIRRAFE